jgi:UDP-glucose 4-epimerase
VLAFRFFNVYGPLQAAGHSYAAVIPAFIDATLRNQPLKVNGDGSQSRDFTYVDSVCGVIWDALVRGVTHDTPVNLALGTRTSINELIDVIGEVAGKQVPVEYHGARVGDVLHSSADPTLLRSLFPNVEAVPLAVGIRNTYEWMASANENRPERT